MSNIDLETAELAQVTLSRSNVTKKKMEEGFPWYLATITEPDLPTLQDGGPFVDGGEPYSWNGRDVTVYVNAGTPSRLNEDGKVDLWVVFGG